MAGINEILAMDWNTIWFAVKIGIFGIILVILASISLFVFTFKYSVQVIEKRGSKDQQVYFDYGRIVSDKDGSMKLKLFKSKKLLPPPEYKHIRILKSMLRKQMVTYYKIGEETYIPVDYENALGIDELRFIPVEQDVSEALSIIGEINQKFDFKDWYEKYGMILMSGIQAACLVVMMIFIVQGLKVAVGGFASTAASFAHSAEEINMASNILANACNAAPVTAPGFGG